MKKEISKKNYVQYAYSILAAEGIDALSIRRLAKEMECNTANLYRYFQGLDELLAYASLRYLADYLSEVVVYSEKMDDFLQLHIKVWDCFSRHSFINPEIFNNLFFGESSRHLDGIIKEYYGLFPEDLKKIDDTLREIFTSGNFDYRSYLMIVRCVNDGWFSPSDAPFLNTLSIHLYKGFLKDVLDNKGDREHARNAQLQFMDCLTKAIRKYQLK